MMEVDVHKAVETLEQIDKHVPLAYKMARRKYIQAKTMEDKHFAEGVMAELDAILEILRGGKELRA